MSEGNQVVRNVLLTVPVRGGWYGIFKGKSGTTVRVPVEAWTYSEYAEAGEDFAHEEGTRLWGALGVWEDGPSEMLEFVDFEGFEPVIGWDR